MADLAPSTGEVLRATTQLLASVSGTPRLDAELLLAHALGISREALLLDQDRPVPSGFNTLVKRRLAHEPVAYITGHRAFWTLELQVSPAVLIPRPDSETLIEAAIAHFAGRTPATIVDLGTGSGALLLAALDQWPTATGLGVDRSADALAVAAENGRRLGFGDRARFMLGDWAGAIDARFDLILCNPPYVEADAVLTPEVAAHEPATALYAGTDGLTDYRRIVPDLPRLLAPRAAACLEIGTTQARAVAAIAAADGLIASVRKDLAGHDRCLTITMP